MTSRPTLRLFFSRAYAAGGAPPTWYLAQPVGGFVAWLAWKAGLNPNHLTAMSGLLSVMGAVVYAINQGVAGIALAWLMLTSAYIVDCADGQLARATARTSEWGGWFDVFSDFFVIAALPLAAIWTFRDALENDGKILLPAAFLFITGRSQDLFTATMFRRGKKESFRTDGLKTVLRKIAVTLTDTLTVTVLFCLFHRSAVGLSAIMTLVGITGAAHAVYAANGRFTKVGG